MAEVRSRLQRAELPAAEIDEAVEELLELGYLDDARYARVFAEDKRNLEDWGSERIERTLRERGVERAVIADVLQRMPDEREDERALALLWRRFPRPSDEPRERERALGVLIRKGYDSDLAYDAVRAWSGGVAPATESAGVEPGGLVAGGPEAGGMGHGGVGHGGVGGGLA